MFLLISFVVRIILEMTIAHLAQFNLVRHFTIGLNEHFRDRRAIKSGWFSSSLKKSKRFFFFSSGLLVLSELFQLDGREKK